MGWRELRWKWRRFTAAGLAVVFLGGTPYLFWRYETRGRFLAVASVMERELALSRGGGPPSDESVRARVLEIAAARSVAIDGLTVTHAIVTEPVASGGPGMPAGIAEYRVEGLMRTSHYGVESTAPLQGIISTQFVGERSTTRSRAR